MSSYYLYGAAIQGIQEFIFQTNELKDIIGASELVDAICTTDFEEFGSSQEPNSIVRAAGNIKYIFSDRGKCEKAVLDFPKKILSKAPGITISQAVVEFDSKDFKQAVNELEGKLRTQRNCPMRSMTLGLMGFRRSRQTGFPVIEKVEDEYLDEATLKKRQELNKANKHLCQKAFGKNIFGSEIPFNIGDIIDKNDWIAIIHADGNGLGQVVQSIGCDKKKLKEFSEKLDKATQLAAQQAYSDIINLDTVKKIPLRPIVLSGDDLTVVIRADLALGYARSYITAFEDQTKCLLGSLDKTLNKGLTVCVGIAYIKSSYPFFYGYELAESLCCQSKKRSKELNRQLPPSCLMFHKVQDSFVERYEDLLRRELTPAPSHSYEFGPYFKETPNSNYWSIDELLVKVRKLDGYLGNSVKNHLREWMSLMNNPERAQQRLNRLMTILQQQADLEKDENKKRMVKELKDMIQSISEGVIIDGVKRYPVHDMMSIYTINNQETK